MGVRKMASEKKRRKRKRNREKKKIAQGREEEISTRGNM